MANYKTVVGVGQVGSRLASLYAKKMTFYSHSTQIIEIQVESN